MSTTETTRSFSNMLNEYSPNKLLKEELLKRDWLLSNIEKDDSWKGGRINVPFRSAGASSVRMGNLTAAGDISEAAQVRGFIDTYKEMWGSMIFNQRDLLDHSGRITEDSFLKILPDTLDEFMDYTKMVASIQMLTGPHFDTLTVSGTVGGVIEVGHVDRFLLGQKVTLKDGNTAAASYYVIAIDVNGGTLSLGSVTLSATRGGAAADVSAYTTGQAAKVYTDGADVVNFTSLRSVLLSATNGGSPTVHGFSKLSAPFLQAVNVPGATINATNILDKLFDAYTQVRQTAKGRADRYVMSYKHFGSVLKLVESKSNGAANWQISMEDKKASIYGWDEITINSVKGRLTIVGVQEMDNDIILLLDLKSMVFRSNGFFRKNKSPDGDEYFVVRNESGYQYIVDTSLFGELEVNKPGHNAIIFGIPNY